MRQYTLDLQGIPAYLFDFEVRCFSGGGGPCSVLALRAVAATTAVVASVVVWTTLDRAEAGGPNTPDFLFFAGTDFWRYGAFLYGGVLWSPGGLDADGFTGIR
jgi:hypothetical protein